MEEYRRCKCSYTTDGQDGVIFGSAIVRIDESRMTMHYGDILGDIEDWRGEFKDGEYQLIKIDNGIPTGGTTKLKRTSTRQLTGTWASNGRSGEWNIALQ